MSITKPDWLKNLWASVPTVGDVVEPPDVLKNSGWTATSNAPPYQYMNWFQNFVQTLARYLVARGIPDWEEFETYTDGDVVQWSVALGGDGGYYYVPLGAGPVTEIAPSNSNYWRRFGTVLGVFGNGTDDLTISADTTILVPTYVRNCTVVGGVTLTLKAPLVVSGTLTVLGTIKNNGNAASAGSYGAGEDYGTHNPTAGVLRGFTRGGNGGGVNANGLPGGDFFDAAPTSGDFAGMTLSWACLFTGGRGGAGGNVTGLAGGVAGILGNTIPSPVGSYYEEVCGSVPGFVEAAINGTWGKYAIAGGTGGGGGACLATGYGGGGGSGGGVVPIAARKIQLGYSCAIQAIGGAGAGGNSTGNGGGSGGGGVIQIIGQEVWTETGSGTGVFSNVPLVANRKTTLAGKCSVAAGAAGVGGSPGSAGKIVLRIFE